MRVLVLHTLPPASVGSNRAVGEFDLAAAAEGLREVLPGAVTAGVRGEPREILALLEQHRPDVVFNACEAPLGRPDLEAHLAALLEWLGVPFTGSGSETLALCRRKDRTSAVLAAAGVPVPHTGRFPCIVKPQGEDGSAWIDGNSICHDEAQLAAVVARLPVPAVTQEFLPGREFAVSLWGERGPEFISIGEYRFCNGLQLNTYASKWDVESADFANSPLFYDTGIEDSLREIVVGAARGAWRAVGARGYLRVDIRLDADDCPKVMDVNPNSELSPGVGISRAVEEAGWTWQHFVELQVECAR